MSGFLIEPFRNDRQRDDKYIQGQAKSGLKVAGVTTRRLFLRVVTPECLYQGSRTIKESPLYKPPKRQQPTLKEKQKMQKTTEGGFSSISGFPIEDFGGMTDENHKGVSRLYNPQRDKN